MNQIKYKSKQQNRFNVQEFSSVLDQSTKQVNIKGEQNLPQGKTNNIFREPQIMIINQFVNDLASKSISSFRINRAKSNQSKFTSLGKRQTPLLRAQTNKEEMESNSQNKFTVLRKNSQYRTSSPRKINIQQYLKDKKGQKIIDFQTKAFKISTKANTEKHHEKEPIHEEQNVSSKINNLYNIVIMNIQQDFNEMKQFHKLNSLINKNKDKYKKQQYNEHHRQQIKQYSNNQIYQQIRKYYKKEDGPQQEFIDKEAEQKPSLGEVKGISLKRPLFLSNQAQKSPSKIKFSVKKSNYAIKKINNDMLSGW